MALPQNPRRVWMEGGFLALYINFIQAQLEMLSKAWDNIPRSFSLLLQAPPESLQERWWDICHLHANLPSFK
jgi:hypothetical protein